MAIVHSRSCVASLAALVVVLLLCAAGFAPASAGPCIGCFGVVTVGQSGIANNCTTASIQTAINLAKQPEWADEVWITNDVANGEYRVGTLNISDQNVALIGGFDNCLDGTSEGYTTISGAGGAQNSVITIRGGSNVYVTGLIITGGDDLAGDGGGIDFKGNGFLEVTRTNIVSNFAAYGGGILASTNGGPLQVRILDSVQIADNVALVNGGGIHINDAALFVTGNGVGFYRNQAVGSNGEGHGGGIYYRMPGSVDISATGFSFVNEIPVFFANRARKGGAIAAVGDSNYDGYANVRISPGVGGGPFVFYGNQAELEGGALYSGAIASSGLEDAESAGAFCAYDTAFRDNVAPDGAAIYYDADSDSAGDRAQGVMGLNGGPGCAGINPRRCATGVACNEFSGNRTERLDNGARTDGAVIEVEGGVGNIQSSGSVFRNNIAGNLVHVGDGFAGSRLALLNCVMVWNDLTGATIDSDSEETVLRHCTIADNTLAGLHVLRIVESAASGFDRLASLTNSIIAQPGKISVDLSGAVDQFFTRYVLATEIGSLRPANSGGTVFIGNPQFENPTLGDYRPGELSTAVDYATAALPDGTADGFQVDALRLPRSVDLPPTDALRSRDLGALERQTRRSDEMFDDGFE